VASGRELLAAWRTGGPDAEGEPGYGDVWSARRSAGGHAFHSPQRVFAGHGRNVVLAANAQGRAVIAFEDAGPNPSAAFAAPVLAAVREPGATSFGAAIQLDDQTPLYSVPAAAVSTAGTATVAYARTSDLTSTPTVIQAAVAPPQGAFDQPVGLGAGDSPLAAASAQTLVVFNGGASWLGVAF
jgi:hypothetical protein